MSAITMTWEAPCLPLPGSSRAGTPAARRPSGAGRGDARRAARAPAAAPRPVVASRPPASRAAEPGRTASAGVALRRAEEARAVPAVRATRRGRLLASLAVGAVVVTGALSAQSAVADDPGEAVTVVARTVAPGETLWSIAGSVAQPGEDLRDVVDRLEVLNGLSGSTIQAGQQLLVPVP